jgi:predicted CoA-binding protein
MEPKSTSTESKRKTVVVGASPNPSRYAYVAANLLRQNGHPVVPLGIRKGDVAGTPILDIRQRPAVSDVDTVTVYLNPKRQSEWYDYLLGLSPRRIIFNPGAENPEFGKRAAGEGIEVVEACTLVMLRSNQY